MTKEEVQLLKRFTAVTPSFVLKNDKITFLSPDKTMCGIYIPQEEFNDFEVSTPLSNVGEFISIVSLFGEDSIINAKDKVIKIKNGKKEVKYVKTNSDYVKEVPEEFIDELMQEEAIIQFDINKEELQEILKISSLLNAGDLRISTKSGELIVEVLDNSNVENNYTTEIEGDFNEEIEVYLDVKLVSILNGDSYTVKVSENKVIFDSGTVPGLTFVIATTNV